MRHPEQVERHSEGMLKPISGPLGQPSEVGNKRLLDGGDREEQGFCQVEKSRTGREVILSSDA